MQLLSIMEACLKVMPGQIWKPEDQRVRCWWQGGWQMWMERAWNLQAAVTGRLGQKEGLSLKEPNQNAGRWGSRGLKENCVVVLLQRASARRDWNLQQTRSFLITWPNNIPSSHNSSFLACNLPISRTSCRFSALPRVCSVSVVPHSAVWN